MKKPNIVPVFAFSVAYAVLFSLGIQCLLHVLSISVAISLDGGSAAQQYPRFIPFCVVVGLLSLVGMVVLFVLNLKIYDMKGLLSQKRIWCVQMIAAFVMSIPMMKLWEMLFELLHKIL